MNDIMSVGATRSYKQYGRLLGGYWLYNGFQLLAQTVIKVRVNGSLGVWQYQLVSSVDTNKADVPTTTMMLMHVFI